jgi:hypothetical protein
VHKICVSISGDPDLACWRAEVALRRLILGCLALGGCTKVNPAWEDSAAASGTSAASSEEVGASSGSSDAGVVPTTGDASSGATGGATDEGSGAVSVTSGDSTSGETGETSSASSEGESTTSALPDCVASELIPISAPLADTGVVPDALGSPCAWGGGPDCGPLNFGKTQFYRLVHDVAGTNAALLRFEIESLKIAAELSGVEPADLIGIRLELVVWEARPAPVAPYALAIHALAPDNVEFGEGNKDAMPADDGDASDLCRTRMGGQCVPWANGGAALDESVLLGELLVTAEKVLEDDKDDLPNEYHAQLLSERLPGGLIFMDRVPGLAVTLATPRPLAEQDVGIKLKEAPPWLDPTLHLELCTEWAP